MDSTYHVLESLIAIFFASSLYRNLKTFKLLHTLLITHKSPISIFLTIVPITVMYAVGQGVTGAIEFSLVLSTQR